MEKYKKVKRLRSAIYGRVYHCTRRSDGLPVAIKVLDKRCVAMQVSREGAPVSENAMRELEVMRLLSLVAMRDSDLSKAVDEHGVEIASLNGSGSVLRLLEDFDDDHFHYIVMEFCNRGELFDLVGDDGVEEDLARALFRQIVRGLEFLHACGFAHRDVSLENVLVNNLAEPVTPQQLSREERRRALVAKVCDFGLAVDQGPTDELGVGKKVYMAPEVMNGTEAYDPMAADMWSLGMSLFILLTGFAPFEAPLEADERYQFIASGELMTLMRAWGFASSLSRGALDLLNRLLVVDPKRRLTLREVQRHPWVAAAPRNQAALSQRARALRAAGLHKVNFPPSPAAICRALGLESAVDVISPTSLLAAEAEAEAEASLSTCSQCSSACEDAIAVDTTKVSHTSTTSTAAVPAPTASVATTSVATASVSGSSGVISAALTAAVAGRGFPPISTCTSSGAAAVASASPSSSCPDGRTPNLQFTPLPPGMAAAGASATSGTAAAAAAAHTSHSTGSPARGSGDRSTSMPGGSGPPRLSFGGSVGCLGLDEGEVPQSALDTPLAGATAVHGQRSHFHGTPTPAAGVGKQMVAHRAPATGDVDAAAAASAVTLVAPNGRASGASSAVCRRGGRSSPERSTSGARTAHTEESSTLRSTTRTHSVNSSIPSGSVSVSSIMTEAHSADPLGRGILQQDASYLSRLVLNEAFADGELDADRWDLLDLSPATKALKLQQATLQKRQRVEAKDACAPFSSPAKRAQRSTSTSGSSASCTPVEVPTAQKPMYAGGGGGFPHLSAGGVGAVGVGQPPRSEACTVM